MPVVHKNALKAARQSDKRRARNRSVHSGVKNVIKKLQTAVENKKTDETAALDRKSTRLNSSHLKLSRMPSSA